MLADIFSIPTLMICSGTVTFVVALALTLAWIGDRSAPALGIWCLSLWIGTAACLALGLRTLVPFWISIGVGNMLGTAAYSIMWDGSRAFDGRPARRALVAAGPVLWLALFVFSPIVREDVNARIIVMSLLVGVYASATGLQILRGGREEALPIRKLAAFFFVTHALVYVLRIPLVLYEPTSYVNVSGYSTWYALITFELFVHTMVAAVVILALIKERAEARYRRASERDPLTGILNRRAFLDRVEAELAKRPHGAMLLLDIDHFKAVNDDHGHLAGDRVLIEFSSAIELTAGNGSVFGRLGGEEFALYVPCIDGVAGFDLAERLRCEISRMAVVHLGCKIGVTVSIGVAASESVKADFAALVGAADFVLYEAKRAGRNRVIAYDPVRHLTAIAEKARNGHDAGPRRTVPLAG